MWTVSSIEFYAELCWTTFVLLNWHPFPCCVVAFPYTKATNEFTKNGPASGELPALSCRSWNPQPMNITTWKITINGRKPQEIWQCFIIMFLKFNERKIRSSLFSNILIWDPKTIAKLVNITQTSHMVYDMQITIVFMGYINHLSYLAVPICSMYGICISIYPNNHPNVGKYTIHGASSSMIRH